VCVCVYVCMCVCEREREREREILVTLEPRAEVNWAFVTGSGAQTLTGPVRVCCCVWFVCVCARVRVCVSCLCVCARVCGRRMRAEALVGRWE
jgi:hypothetical protein